MQPAKQLRYDPRKPSAIHAAPASFDESILSPTTSVTGPALSIDTIADELGDTALRVHLYLRRGSWLYLEEQRSPAGATIFSIGSVAWYLHLYGGNADAMTPAEEGLHPTQYPWEHTKWNKTYDHQALRRGFQVYREVCASCHSISRVPYRSLVGTMMTVDEAKALAEENEYDTEPNDQGEIEKRPGKLSDYMPAPYKNDEAARAANNGSPRRLQLHLQLVDWLPEEPPAGAVVQEGLNFNPYFPGTGIAMARVLYDDLVEYEDGTQASTSQMAKDVVEFLNWTAEPEMDDRKKMGWKVLAVTSVLFTLSVWVKRYKWAPLKTRKIIYSPPAQKKSVLDYVSKPNNQGKTNQ
ncbi:hypothetical protein EJ07DRAFT_155145 [Lizonia empirigonia]|nr:hypothetical protein EJ07DRAFT_155145 [Lizonia empirigonia]